MNPAAELLFSDLKECEAKHPWLADWQAVAGTLCRDGSKPIIRDLTVGDRWYQQMLHYVEHIQRIRIYGMDITDRRRAEAEREITIQFLRLVNENTDTARVDPCAATTFFQEQSGCEAVGVRLKDGDDYPYYEARGISRGVRAVGEQSLRPRCSRGHHSRFGRLSDHRVHVRQRDLRAIRPVEAVLHRPREFLDELHGRIAGHDPEADRQARTRNRCNGEGYESVALLPLHVGGSDWGCCS